MNYRHRVLNAKRWEQPHTGHHTLTNTQGDQISNCRYFSVPRPFPHSAMCTKPPEMASHSTSKLEVTLQTIYWGQVTTLLSLGFFARKMRVSSYPPKQLLERLLLCSVNSNLLTCAEETKSQQGQGCAQVSDSDGAKNQHLLNPGVCSVRSAKPGFPQSANL